MRCSMLLTSLSAPSAVCASEMPSLALRMPWLMPRICEVIDEAMARPAASSFALLMRLPVDRRSMAVPRALLALVEALAALSAPMLVLITDIDELLRSFAAGFAIPRHVAADRQTGTPSPVLSPWCRAPKAEARHATGVPT